MPNIPPDFTQLNIAVPEETAKRIRIWAVTYGITTGAVVALLIDHTGYKDIESILGAEADRRRRAIDEAGK